MWDEIKSKGKESSKKVLWTFLENVKSSCKNSFEIAFFVCFFSASSFFETWAINKLQFLSWACKKIYWKIRWMFCLMRMTSALNFLRIFTLDVNFEDVSYVFEQYFTVCGCLNILQLHTCCSFHKHHQIHPYIKLWNPSIIQK